VVESCNTLVEQISRQEMMAPRITVLTFPRFASRDFQVLRKFFAKAAPKTLLHVGTNGIQAPDLLLDQFASTIILPQKFGIGPKIIKQLAGNLINTK